MNTERWLTTVEAAKHLGYSPYTLRRARVDKMLSGKTEPSYIKSGRAVRYKLSDLDAWMNGEQL
jgi:predicted DNA-binding transcriptional regulator AlpA